MNAQDPIAASEVRLHMGRWIAVFLRGKIETACGHRHLMHRRAVECEKAILRADERR